MVKPPADTDFGPAVCAYAVAELEAAIDGLAQRGARLHAGVHRARKGMRRTRAVLALLPADAGVRLLDRGVRRVNRSLSPLRDAHALVETVERLAALHRAPASLAWPRVRRAAAAYRRGCKQAVLDADPGMAGARAQLEVLRAALGGVRWRLDGDALEAALGRTAARAAAAGARAVDSSDDADWHRWRRRLRRLSQQRRAAAAAGAADELSAYERSVAEQLGLAQDLVLLRARCGEDAPFRPDDRIALRRLATRLLARQRRRIAAVLAETR